MAKFLVTYENGSVEIVADQLCLTPDRDWFQFYAGNYAEGKILAWVKAHEVRIIERYPDPKD